VDGLSVSFAEAGPCLAISVAGFDSETAAREYLPHLRAAMYWVAAREHLTFTAEREMGRAFIADDPFAAAKNFSKSFGTHFDRVDGATDNNFPCVFPSSKQLHFLQAGDAHVVLGTPLDRFARALAEGLQYTTNRTLQDARLVLALDLFCSAAHERSQNARLIALAMSFEVLADPLPKAAVVQELLDRWDADIAKALLSCGLQERDAIESLRRELKHRRSSSIRSSVKALSAASGLGRDEVKRAQEIYDLRSQLVHQGSIPEASLGQAILDCERLLSHILLRQMSGTAYPDPPSK